MVNYPGNDRVKRRTMRKGLLNLFQSALPALFLRLGIGVCYALAAMSGLHLARYKSGEPYLFMGANPIRSGGAWIRSHGQIGKGV